MNAIVWTYLPCWGQDDSTFTLLLNGLRTCGINLEDCFQRYVETWRGCGLGTGEEMLHALVAFPREWVLAVFGNFQPVASKLQCWRDASIVKVSWENSTLQRLMTWLCWLEALEYPNVKLLKVCLSELPRSLVQQAECDHLDHRLGPLMKFADLEMEDDGVNTGFLHLASLREGLRGIAGSGLLEPNSSWLPPVRLAACRWCCEFMDRPEGRVKLNVLKSHFEELNGVNQEFRKETLELIFKMQHYEATLNNGRSMKLLEKVPFRFSDALKTIDMPSPEWPTSFQ